jgi:NADH:ubiquinone oxidoreductase subunit 4 (subunit M)
MQICYLSLPVLFGCFMSQKNILFSYSILFLYFSFQNFFLHLAIDGVSLTLIFLSTFLLPFCILVSWQSIVYRTKLFYFLLYSVVVLLFFVFTSVDLLFFYFFFEIILIPMFILIGVWGSRERKIQAAYKFFIYTFIGSVFFLIAILFIYSAVGSVNYFCYYKCIGRKSNTFYIR